MFGGAKYKYNACDFRVKEVRERESRLRQRGTGR